MTKKVAITTTVNGRTYEADVQPRRTLADFLRHDLGFTGVHLGCEHGVCGACTVLIDGSTARSCCMLAVQADGESITTVEGLSDGSEMHPLQESFWKCHGLQCGFCTPGMLLTACELLADDPDPSEEQIRERISGNLCRCTGYQFIVDAIKDAAGRTRCAAAPLH
ncbi:MAG TPA: (2Fe-2S)-binding protein [Sporichthyaceae bacterium]|jgi:carbon-monoxide dehydrogenase small subunit|nr:(2Fe-2S)-binding protein [Sporichthyaceae bacterium]